MEVEDPAGEFSARSRDNTVRDLLKDPTVLEAVPKELMTRFAQALEAIKIRVAAEGFQVSSMDSVLGEVEKQFPELPLRAVQEQVSAAFKFCIDSSEAARKAMSTVVERHRTGPKS